MKLHNLFLTLSLTIFMACDHSSAGPGKEVTPDPFGGEVDEVTEADLNHSSAPFSEHRPIRVLKVRLGGEDYFNVVTNELKGNQSGLPAASVTELTWPEGGANPFAISEYNFELGALRRSFTEAGPAPLFPEASLRWFADQVASGNVPDVVIIGGHHVPGLGWHGHYIKPDNYYEKTLTSAKLFASARRHKVIREYFSHVKLAFIGGCWAMANLEPHGPNGEYLSPDDIARTYFSSDAGRQFMLGNESLPNSLAYQRHELTTLYGRRYKAEASEEVCSKTKRFCQSFHVTRVLPDYALYDGSHTYNAPYIFRRLFPNSALVMGFHSPSPYSDQVGSIVQTAISAARNELGLSSPLRALIDSATPLEVRRQILTSVRVQWTRTTHRLNRGRTAGSITPAFPDLDANGPFAYYDRDPELPLGPRFSPYRPTE
jgi:hypothetical protein